MIRHPNIDPVAVSFGPFKVHWYGLMYLLGFAAGYGLGLVRARRPESGWRSEEVSDLLFYTVLGIILGGRLGYAIFYNLPYYLTRPHELLYLWSGGMSFHGG
ncbi:MAG: prolipoprotein diacylglyceryl transferase, partial [Gammaproteobacteria bacterium]|nr:prolipoprotein diacylglyceryl transferase [Gammaproteobacteria bacterium]